MTPDDSLKRMQRIRDLLTRYSGAGMPAKSPAFIQIHIDGSLPADIHTITTKMANLSPAKAPLLRIVIRNGSDNLVSEVNTFASQYPSEKIEVLLDSAFLPEDLSSCLANLRLKSIVIRHCAVSDETYRKLTGSDDFERVCSLIRQACQSNAEQGFPQLLVGHCEFDSRNIREASGIIELFRSFGFARVDASYRYSALHTQDPWSLVYMRDEVDLHITASRQKAASLGIPYSSPALFSECGSWGMCSSFESPLIIDENGLVYPCKAMYHLSETDEGYFFGNCASESWDRFTYGDNFRMLRWSAVDGSAWPTENCLACQKRFETLSDLPDPSGKTVEKKREDAIRVFTETIVQFVESGNLSAALLTYKRQRSHFPSDLPELIRFDQLIGQIENKISSQR